jgi:hypothetical protein
LAERAEHPEQAIPARLRRPEAGHKRKTEEFPELVEELERLVDPVMRGSEPAIISSKLSGQKQITAETRRTLRQRGD